MTGYRCFLQKKSMLQNEIWVFVYFQVFYLLGTTEYLFPIQSKMVPLMDRCYLAMTQALESRLGGSFGPAYPQKKLNPSRPLATN